LKNDPKRYREYLEEKREYNKKRYRELKQNSEKIMSTKVKMSFKKF